MSERFIQRVASSKSIAKRPLSFSSSTQRMWEPHVVCIIRNTWAFRELSGGLQERIVPVVINGSPIRITSVPFIHFTDQIIYKNVSSAHKVTLWISHIWTAVGRVNGRWTIVAVDCVENATAFIILSRMVMLLRHYWLLRNLSEKIFEVKIIGIVSIRTHTNIRWSNNMLCSHCPLCIQLTIMTDMKQLCNMLCNC